ncbi:Aldehyde/histidinol dehydrogenase [Paraphysoderma sedebokerense]|nr:Aldehyde/histidinol dehydrogenase [Paraphysoderma sedebokerense]
MTTPASSIVDIAKAAREASYCLQTATSEQKSIALKKIKEYLAKEKDEILAANAEDMRRAAESVKNGNMSESLMKRLDLNGKNGEKFATLLEGIDQVDKLDDPTGKITLATKLDDGLELYRVSCPIGVCLIIFEARPEVVVQISTLAIKSGNALILKGGSESISSLTRLQKTIHNALSSLPTSIQSAIPETSIQLVSSREDVSMLLGLDKYIDLVIPRGGNSLVRYVKDHTRIPVLGHADGICSIYVDESADVETAVNVIHDSKTNYPAACNSLDNVIFHTSTLETHLFPIAQKLFSSSVTIHATPKIFALLRPHAPSASSDSLSLLQTAKIPESFHTEYLSLGITFLEVDDIQQAIKHINTYGSGHTDGIITKDKNRSEIFMKMVDSAGVYVNASTRFADGFRYGFGAEIGVSTNKTHSRGPVGLEGLVIYKYKLYGNGHCVGMFGDGAGKRKYLHEKLPL